MIISLILKKNVMKNIFYLLLLLGFLSCSENKEHVEVAKGYVLSIYNHKLSEVGDYSTQSTAERSKINITRGVFKLTPDFEFRLLSDSVSNERAWVTFDNANKENSKQTIPLIKLDGQWKVHYD